MPDSPCRLVARLGLLAAALALAPATFAQVTATNGLLDPAAPEDHIRVDWTNGSPSQGTNIYYAEVIGGVVGPETYLGTTASATGFSFTRDTQGIRPGVEYRFRLRRFDPVAGAFVEMGTVIGARVPRTPETLDASENRLDGVAVTWTDRSAVELGYVVYRGAPGDAGTVAGLTEIARLPAGATTHLDETAAAFVRYQYCVGQLDTTSGAEATLEPLACDTGAAGPAFVVQATAGGAPAPEAHVRVDWTPTGVVGELYEIRRTVLPADGPAVPEGVIAVRPQGVTSFVDTRARPGTTYRYCVTPVTSGALEACADGSRELRRPTVLTTTDRTRVDGVALTWVDRSSVELGYVVYRGAPGTTPTTAIHTTTPDATGYLDESGDPLVAYAYCVGLLDGFGGTEAVSAPLACADGTRGAILPPAGVAASDGTLGDRVRVAWTARPAVTYTVYRSAAGQPQASVASDLDASPFDDLAAVAGTAYTYCVTASTDGGESVQACDAGQRGGLASPDSLTASSGTSDSAVDLAWNDPGTTETGFRIYRQLTAGRGPDELVAELPANRTRYADTGAVPGESYDFSVTAIATVKVDGVDVTTESARRYGQTTGHRSFLLAPAGFAATDAETGDEGFVELTWTSASDVVQLFLVRRDGQVLATLPPFARSYRDATGRSGQTYDYQVVAMTVIGVDAAGLRQGLAPLFSRAAADKGALAAERGETDDAAARARLDARAAALEAKLTDDIRALLAGLGVDAADLTGAAGTEIRTAATAEVEGARRLRAPGTLAATTTLEDRIRISWADRSGIEADYEVRATYDAGVAPTTTRIGPNRTEFIDIGAPAGADVRYEVRVVDNRPGDPDSGSAWAEVTGRRVLLPPGRVTALQRLVETELVVAWRDSSRAETGYAVTAELAAGTQTVEAAANARQVTVPIQPADFGTAIRITVRAVAPVPALPGVPSGSAPVAVTATPTFLPPSVVTASTEYGGQVVVSWTDDSDANEGYRVVRRGSAPDTLDVTGTTAIDLSTIGPATYCVTPTRTGSSDAEPEAVCANGRTSTATVPSTGDVVTTPRVASGLNTSSGGSFGPRYGYALSASGANAIVSSWADGMALRFEEAPHWAIPYGGYPNNYNVGTSRDGIGMVSIYERSSGGWTDAQRIQIGPGAGADQRFTYGLFGWDVDIEGDVAIVGAPGQADFVTHPNMQGYPVNIPARQATFTYADGGAYIFTRDPNTGQWNRDPSRMIRAPGLLNNQFTLVQTGAWYDFLPHNYIDAGVTSVTSQVCTILPAGTIGCTGIDPYTLGVAPGPVRSLGQRVALTPDWAFVSRLENGSPRVGAYQASQNWDWQRDLTVPAGFDTGGLRSLAATAGAVAMGSGASNTVHLFALTRTTVSATPDVVIDRSADAGVNPLFGAVVDVSGDLLAVGGYAGAGAVSLYRKDESTFAWAPELGGELAPDAGDTGFGKAVTVEGEVVLVGANAADGTGVVYTFRQQPGGEWAQVARLTREGETPSATSNFGGRVAIAGEDLIIGADRVTTPGGLTGAVYFATLSTPPGSVDASDGRYANRVQVRWEDRAQEEDGYRVYRRGPSDADYVLIGTLGPNVEITDDFDVSPGDAYSYCVASFFGEDESDTNPLGESGRSCDAGYTPPNGTITGRLATGEGAPVLGAGVCLAPGLDQAVMFDGLAGRAVASSFGSLPTAFTMEAWINADLYDDGANPVAGVDGPSYAMLEVVGASGAGSPRLRVQNTGDPAATVIDAPALSPGWHHLAATHDGSTLALYVDGQPAGTAAFGAPSEARGAFQIAADLAGNAFDGRLDDIRLWSRAFTPAQVAAAHEQALPLEGDETDLYAYWAIDQGIGRILTDLTEGGRHATLQGGAEWTQEAAPLNTCALSDRDGNYTFAGLRYGDRTAFRITPTDPSRQFTPAARTSTLTPESPTENQLDFTDTSSFTVRGQVVHTFDQADWPGQAPLPAAGVDILVDGAVAATTESDGTFAVAVRGTGLHVFEARNDSLGLAFTAAFDGEPFADGSAELATPRDLDGLVFSSTTRRILRGQATGGCSAEIGDLAFRIYTDDRRFDRTFPAAGASPLGADPYIFNLPPLRYNLEFVSVANVPAPLSQTAVLDYFRNLGVLAADLRTEADTVDFRYRAPITLVVERGGAPFGESAAMCSAGFTVFDADGNADRTLPTVPVIAEYERVPLVLRAYEDYGGGNECAVEAGTVRVFDGFADAADAPVELALDETGRASYTTFGRSPDTFAGRTVGGIDRSYQKSLTAVLELPEGGSVTTTEWAFVEGYREKPATFVTATMGEIPVMVLRDPPGSQSSAYVEEGTSSCVSLSQLRAVTAEGGVAVDLKLGFKLLTGLFVIVENGFGVHLAATTTVGGTTQNTTGPESNISVCATTNERWQTSGAPQWTGEDLYTGVGLNVLFAEADVLATDTSNLSECRVDLSTALATGLDDADPFETVFAYGSSHIEDVLIPELESLARLAGEDSSVDGSIDGQDASVPLSRAIQNWHGMLAYNDSLTTAALSGEVENRSFSGGTSYEFGTTADTTLTVSGSNTVYFKTENRVGILFTVAGHDSVVDAVINFNTQTTTTREETGSETFGVGYTLADDDAGDSFTVDVARDPRYGTYVFNTVSGASSNPWEPNTQKRDLPLLAVDPPQIDGVLEGDRAVFTLSLTNASESDERREYLLDAPAHLNPDGAVLRVNGAVLSQLAYTVDPRQTISIPVTVERGPLVDDYDLTIVTYAPGDLHRVAADTARFSASFRPLVAPLRLTQPEDGWAVTLATPTLNFLLSDIDVGSQARFGVAYRRANGAWQEDIAFTADDLAPGATEIPYAWTPDGLPDGAYELRAFARSATAGPPDYYGPSVPGWLDKTAPLAYGPPQPADGELALGETIGITFEEPVGCDAFRARLAGSTAAAELLGQDHVTTYAVTVGCADRTVLLVPADESLWRALEGQRVTARLRGVPDAAGNPMARLASADGVWDATWPFTVRRNAFGWTPAVVAARGQRDVPMEIPAALVNGRSQPVVYSLVPNNPTYDPAALPAAPAAQRLPLRFESPGGPVYTAASGFSGTVVSGDVQPIGFSWPGAPDGVYSARVEVTSSEAGVDLPLSSLALTVEVSCAAPDWLAQAAAIAPAFEQSMALTAALYLGGAASATDDTDDLLAAFVDGEIRGAAAIRMVNTAGGPVPLAELLVYGTGAPERILFKAWDADACVLHQTSSRVEEFVGGTSLGSLTPLRIDAPGAAGAPLEVPLAAGWTWVSTNRSGTSPLASALVGVGASADDLIQGQRAFSRYVPGSGWTAGLSGMTPGEGYHIYLGAPATMTHPGAPVDPTTPIGLLAGWNWIGFLPQAPLPLDEALASVTFAENDAIKNQEVYATYVDGFGWIGRLTTLAPGIGYHLYVADDATLTYPAATSGMVAGAVPAGVRSARPVRRMDVLPEPHVGFALHSRPLSDAPPPMPEESAEDGPVVASASASASTAVLPVHEHTMIVTATFADAPEGLHVAAYVATEAGEQLRGLAPVETVEALGATRAFLLANGMAGETLVLRPVLVADGGALVPAGDLRFPDGVPGAGDPASTDALLPFVRDAIVGTAASPVTLALSGATAGEESPLPTEVGLAPTRPNPFATEATFAFGLPAASAVRLVVYDVLGREVAVLVDEERHAGHHTVRFDGRALASGTYIARLTAGPEVRTRTFTVAR